ncbi:MAG: hypothetical protein P8Y65_08105 [Campylobacterales bacterium]|jgi:hypothetical protein
MKKPAAFILAALSTLYVNSWAGPSDLYVGLDVFGGNNDFDVDVSGSIYGSGSFDDDSKGFKLKFGALLVNDLRLQGYLQSENFDDPIFDNTNDQLVEIGIDLIKEFIVSPELSPFIQGGIGYGAMDLDRYYYTDDAINEINLKVGLGLMFRVTPAVELLAGVDFQWRRWSDITYDDGYDYFNVETKDSSQRYYGGVNFHF